MILFPSSPPKNRWGQSDCREENSNIWLDNFRRLHYFELWEIKFSERGRMIINCRNDVVEVSPLSGKSCVWLKRKHVYPQYMDLIQWICWIKLSRITCHKASTPCRCSITILWTGCAPESCCLARRSVSRSCLTFARWSILIYELWGQQGQGEFGPGAGLDVSL